jgi:hypothetical protein
MPEDRKSVAVQMLFTIVVTIAVVVPLVLTLLRDYHKTSSVTPPEALQAVRLAEQMPPQVPWQLDYRIQTGTPQQVPQYDPTAPAPQSWNGIPPHYPRGLWSRYEIDMQREQREQHLPNGGMVLPDGTYVPPNDPTAWLLQDLQLQNRLFDYYVNGGM